MAITDTPSKVVVRLMLATGTSSTGTVRTVGVSLGTLYPSYYNQGGSSAGDTKAYAIAGALAACMQYSTNRVEKVGTSTLDEE